MPTLLVRSFGVAMLSVLLLTSAQAQEVVALKTASLAVIPGKAPIVVQLRGLEAAPKRLGAMLTEALPDMAGPINASLAKGLKSLPFMDGRELAAIDLNASVFLVIGSLEDLSGDSPPEPALVLPVKDYAAFKTGVLTKEEQETLKKDGVLETVEVGNKTLYLYPTAGSLVVCANKDNINLFLTKGARLDKVMPAGVMASFLGNDGAVYVNLGAVNQQYGDMLQTFKTLMELGLAQGGNVDPKQAEMAKAIFGSLFQGIADGTGLVLATDFKPSGWDFHFHIGFGKETTTSEGLAKMKPGPLSGITTLPKGQLSYAILKMDPALRRALSGAATPGTDEDDKVTEAIAEAMKEYFDSGITEAFSATSSGTSKGLEVLLTKDPAKAKAAMVKVFSSLTAESKMQNMPLLAKPKVIPKAGTVMSIDFTGIELKLDTSKLLEDPQIPEPAKAILEPLLKKLVPGTIKTWIGASDTAMISVTAPSWEDAEKLLTVYLEKKDTVADDKGFLAVRSALPKEANMLMMIDGGRAVASAIEMIGSVANDSGMVPTQIPIPKTPKGPAGYIGASITMQEGSLQGNLLFSTGAIKSIRGVVMPLVQQIRGGVQ